MPFSISKYFSRTKPPNSKTGKDTLANSAKIGALFQHLSDDHDLITITIPGSPDRYTSAVLNVDKTAKTFSLDEISPTEGHRLFLETKKLQVEGHSRGALFSFNLQLQRQGSSRGIAYYEFDYPTTINYVQRRASYRAHLKSDQQITVTTWHNESKTSISGYVIDISNHGICILFNTDREIQHGEVLTLCKLRLPDNQQAVFDLEVRHTRTLPSERLRVGGRFQNLNTRHSQMISKLVRQLERAALRK